MTIGRKASDISTIKQFLYAIILGHCTRDLCRLPDPLDNDRSFNLAGNVYEGLKTTEYFIIQNFQKLQYSIF